MEYKYGKEKIIITGMGTSGTTALTFLFYNLGFEIGMSGTNLKMVQSSRDPNVRHRYGEYIGLDFMKHPDTRKSHRHHRNRDGLDISPRVIKQATHEGWEKIPEWPETYGWVFEHVFFCVRNTEEWRESKKKRNVPAHRVEAAINRLPTTLVAFDPFPMTIMVFPKFARDAEYCYKKLEPVLECMSFAEFKRGWDKTMDEKKISVG